jgi:hypothetical protein
MPPSKGVVMDGSRDPSRSAKRIGPWERLISAK